MPRRVKRTKSKSTRSRRERKIFISYRRCDSTDISGRLYDRLALRYGRNQVIKDVNSIPPGTEFRTYIESVIPTCSAVIALIGPKWQSPTKSKKRPPATIDYVRLELSGALMNSIPVIPVLIGKTKMPSSRSLPKDLRELVKRHATQLRSDPDFHHDVDRLLEFL